MSPLQWISDGEGGNTSNLQSHLKNHHPLKFADIKQAKSVDKPTTTRSCAQTTIDVAMAKSEKYSQSSKRWQQLTDSVTHCLARDMMPIYSADKPGFRRMLEQFDPRYTLPTHKYFSNEAIPSLYVRTRETVAGELRAVEYFTATSDLWSSSTLEPPYMSYTVHYVTADWTLQTRCLQTLYLPEDHTGVNLAEALAGTLGLHWPN